MNRSTEIRILKSIELVRISLELSTSSAIEIWHVHVAVETSREKLRRSRESLERTAECLKQPAEVVETQPPEVRRPTPIAPHHRLHRSTAKVLGRRWCRRGNEASRRTSQGGKVRRSGAISSL